MNKVVSYDNVKDSKVLWLGNVPDHWGVVPHRAIFDEVKDVNKPKATMLSVTIKRGIIPQSDLLMNSRKKDSSRVDKSKYKFVKIGDLAYNKMRAWQGALGISKYEGIVSPAYVIQRPHNQKVIAKYYHYLMRTPSFHKEAERWSYGITSDMWSLRPEHFKMIYTLLPPPDEQAAIVKYLDHATARLDRAIAAKRRVVKLLDEQKQAIIHRAVTRGLDENARLKDSGIQWLGKVPENWDIVRAQSFIDLITGYPFKSEDFSKDGKGTKLLRGVNVGVGNVRWTDTVFWKAKDGENLTPFALKVDDMVLGMDRPFISRGTRVAKVQNSDLPAFLLQRVARIRTKSGLNADYLFAILSGPLFDDYMRPLFSGISVPHISPKQIKMFVFGKPTETEQIKIVKYLNSVHEKFGPKVKLIQKEVSLLEEFRTALISEVVTGKRDVRTLAAALPDMQSQDEILFDDDDGLGDDLMEDALA